MREAWDEHAEDWVTWARADGHDSYWRFHRDAFLALVPPPRGRTLDVGCGEGRLTRHLRALGHDVVAVDGSPTMVAAARSHPEGPGTIALADAAGLPFASESFSLVVAFMSLHDIDGWERALAEAARVLGADGRLAVAVVHPINSAGRFAGSDDDVQRPFVIEEPYFERRRTVDVAERAGLRMTFVSEHRTMAHYVNGLIQHGFALERVAEVPDVEGRWTRLPLFLHLLGRRQRSPLEAGGVGARC